MFPYFPTAADELRAKRKDEDRPSRGDAPKRSAAIRARAANLASKRAVDEADEDDSEESDESAQQQSSNNGDEQATGGGADEDDDEDDEEEAEDGIEKIISFKIVPVAATEGGAATQQKEYRMYHLSLL